MSTHVLIIDDEPDVTTYLSAVLTSNGFTTTVATNADEGLQSVRTATPDLICLDIMMPGESGISVLHQLREDADTAQIPVIIVSGVAGSGEFDFRAYEPDSAIRPPEGYFEKPIDTEEFVQLARNLTAPAAKERQER